MSPKRERVDFVDFLRDAERDPGLLGQFLSKKTAKELYDFFFAGKNKKKKMYLDIPYNDCEEIIKIFNATKKYRVQRNGKWVKDCIGGQKEY